MYFNKAITTLVLLCLMTSIYATNIDCLYQLQLAEATMFDLQAKALEKDAAGALLSQELLALTANRISAACPEIQFAKVEGGSTPKLSCKESLNYIGHVVDGVSDDSNAFEALQKLLQFSDNLKEACAQDKASAKAFNRLITLDDIANAEDSLSLYDDTESGSDSSSDSSDAQPPNFNSWNVASSDDSDEEEEDELSDTEKDEEVDSEAKGDQTEKATRDAQLDKIDDQSLNLNDWNDKSDSLDLDEAEEEEEEFSDSDEVIPKNKLVGINIGLKKQGDIVV